MGLCLGIIGLTTKEFLISIGRLPSARFSRKVRSTKICEAKTTLTGERSLAFEYPNDWRREDADADTVAVGITTFCCWLLVLRVRLDFAEACSFPRTAFLRMAHGSIFRLRIRCLHRSNEQQNIITFKSEGQQLLPHAFGVFARAFLLFSSFFILPFSRSFRKHEQHKFVPIPLRLDTCPYLGFIAQLDAIRRSLFMKSISSYLGWW